MPVDYQLLIDWNSDGDWADLVDDVSARLLPDIACERGKDQIRFFSPPMAGRCDAILDNRSRDYSPTQENIRITEGGDTRITESGDVRVTDFGFVVEPGKGIRFNVNSTPLWTGILEDIPQEPDIFVKRVRIAGLGKLARLAEKTISTTLYQNIRTDQALGYILDQLNWPVADRVLSTGDVTLEWWWLDGQTAFSAIVEILNTEGAQAAIYEDGQGRFVFENRNYRSVTSRSLASQHDFSTTTDLLEFSYHPDYQDIINTCALEINHREAQAVQEIWANGEDVVFGANETKTFIIRASDPFTSAEIPSAAPSNASQTLTPSTTLSSGTFKLRFRGVTTAGTVAFNATAAAIQTALEGLSSIGSGNVLCTGGPINTTAVFVTFVASLGGQNMTDLIEIVENTLNVISVGGMIEVSENQSGGGLRIEVQTFAPSGTLTAGTFTVAVSYSGGAGTTSSLNYNDSAATIQTAIRAVSGFGSTLCFGGPMNTFPVQVNFANVNEDMDLAVITGTGLMTTAAGATIDVAQGSVGGVPDYIVTAGGLITSKSLDRTSGQSVTLSMTAGSIGATLRGLRLRARPVTVVRSERVENNDDVAVSVTKYGIRPVQLSIRSEINRTTAQAVANSFTAYYQSPRPTAEITTCSAFTGLLTQQLNREISDRVKITDAQTGIDSTFFIERIRHVGTISALYTKYGCEKATHADTHSDTAHSDSTHTDSHTDTAHTDSAHVDSHSDAATHSDVAHSDTAHSDTAHSDTAHTDSAHADSHSDDLHSDDHSDTHGDTAHTDSHSDAGHSDSAHTDSHSDTHSDSHSDFSDFGPTHTDSHTDTHTDTHSDVAHADSAHSDDHSDTAHSDAAHSDSHSDAAHADSHSDTEHSDEAHSDTAHSDAAHGDTAHSDSAHSDEHTDTAHGDSAHADSHTDTAHGDSAHSDTHSDAS